MPIVIAGQIRVPADKRAYLLATAQPLMTASRAETGCEHYHWSSDSADPELIHVFEQWRDEPCLREHFAGDPYLGTLKLFAETCEFEADVRKFRVDIVEPVYDDSGTPRADFFTA